MPYDGQPHFYEDYSYSEETFEGCQCPISGRPHFYVQNSQTAITKSLGVNALSRADLISTSLSRKITRHKKCVNALSRANLISTLPLREPSVYAALRACFCMYFSEYSDKYSKQGAKVGRSQIVFIQIQFLRCSTQLSIPQM